MFRVFFVFSSQNPLFNPFGLSTHRQAVNLVSHSTHKFHARCTGIHHNLKCLDDFNAMSSAEPTTTPVIREGKVTFAPGVSTGKVFYNPIQEFNRDISCLVLSVFLERYQDRILQRKRRKLEVNRNPDTPSESHQEDYAINAASSTTPGFTVFEAMAASGLRACRYALEVPLVAKVIANDLDASACEAISKNAAFNSCLDKIEITNRDAKAAMYEAGFRQPQKLYDAIDLDPFGSAAPFVDAAVHSIADGGLLMVTCTDTSILCGNFPEACYARYGSTAVRNPAHHEISLRIVLNRIASTAMLHEKYIEPLLSVREGHYVRLFVAVHRGAKEAKENVRKTGYMWNCTFCHAFGFQPICDTYKTAYANASIGLSNVCESCGTTMKIGGPIWIGQLHNTEFVEKLIAHLGTRMESFGTSKYMHGKLAMIHEELPDQPLYIVGSEMFKVPHCEPIPSKKFLSAILRAGYRFSSSHCEPEAIKTDAPFHVIWDIIRSWIEVHPVNPSRLSDTKIQHLLSIPCKIKADFTPHPDADFLSRSKKLMRFPTHEISGPMAKPKARHHNQNGDAEPEIKKIKLVEA